mmetsp:Transcript_63239/g.72502  ORF Transcript_63239/g.72502 Transcript_63239/m.72502 type:complete len:361 (-) Transcript_63239:16-1098(-)
MGIIGSKKQEELNTAIVSKSHFAFHYVIGRGNYGDVWKASKRNSSGKKQYYGIKQMMKTKILTKRSVPIVHNERRLLSELEDANNCIVRMHYAFQDREYLYLVLDYMPGGDLRYLMTKIKQFTEEQARFVTASLVRCLEGLHAQQILHRDIKPENILFDKDGYMHLTDFQLAKVWHPDNAQDTSGTPGYMAPEVMARQNHGIAADFFSVGIIAYEMMTGRRPYNGKTRKEVKDQIMARQVLLKKNDIPEGWSLEAADFINETIQRQPLNRLGLNGASEAKKHHWLKDYKWEYLEGKNMRSPLYSRRKDNFSLKATVTNDPWTEDNPEVAKQNKQLVRRTSIQNLFKGYYYDSRNRSDFQG